MSDLSPKCSLLLGMCVFVEVVITNAALHVIVMDEFDAVARSRGGSDGKGGQGDAGVA